MLSIILYVPTGIKIFLSYSTFPQPESDSLLKLTGKAMPEKTVDVHVNYLFCFYITYRNPSTDPV